MYNVVQRNDSVVLYVMCYAVRDRVVEKLIRIARLNPVESSWTDCITRKVCSITAENVEMSSSAIDHQKHPVYQ